MQNLKYIDNHTHGCYGINFNYATYNETIFVLKKLYERNIAGICPTLVGESRENIQKQLSIFKKIKQEQLQLNHQNTSLVLGVHLEGSFISKEKSGIQDKNFFMIPSVKNFKELAGDFEDIIKIVTIAPENDIDLVDYLNDKNIRTQAGHTTADDLKNTKATTHHFNAMPSIHHRNPSIALKGLIKDDIYCEIIADFIHSSKDTLKLFFKTKPKEKVLLISDSIPCAHFENDIVFCGKKINKYGKDETETLAGSIKTLDEIAKNLVENNILVIEDIKKMAFLNQIEYITPTNAEVDILMQKKLC